MVDWVLKINYLIIYFDWPCTFAFFEFLFLFPAVPRLHEDGAGRLGPGVAVPPDRFVGSRQALGGHTLPTRVGDADVWNSAGSRVGGMRQGCH